MAEYFPGITPEASSDDDDDSSEFIEKKTSKKTERSASKESKADDKAEKREREDAVPLEKLADDEKSVIAAELARLRAEAAQQELVEAVDGSIEQTEAIPVVEFDQALQRNLEDGQPFEEALENAEAVATELIGEELDTDTDEEMAEDVPEGEPNDTEDDHENDDEDVTTPQGNTGRTTPPPVSPPTPPAGGAGGVPPNGPGGNAGSGGQGVGGGGVPPHTPAGPTPNVPGGPPGGPGGAGPNAQYGPNLAPAAANIAPSQAPEEKSVAPYILAGGILGYMVGRRRGRIKTEKRLLPVQKKLEKQVTDLEKQIMFKEEKIRTLTRKQAEVQPALQANMAERKQAQQTSRTERQIALEAEKKTETVIVEQKRAASERLGKLAFRQEAVTTRSTEQRTKSVELMTKPELLAIAERIKVEQGNVKRLYETGRLDDKGLRRVLEAYLSGQAYERVLRDQLRSSEVKIPGIESDPTKISELPSQNSSGAGASSASSQQATSGWQSNSSPAYNPTSPPQNNMYGVPGQNTGSYGSSTSKASNAKQVVGITIVVLMAVVIAIILLF